MTAVSITNLHKRFGSVVAVDGIDLTVNTGECFGLLGPNGAGKTTTIEICEGLTAPDTGDVRILGLTWNGDSRGLRQRLGIQLQETQLAEKLTVEETIRLFRSFYARGLAVNRLVDMVQLHEKRNARVGTLSGGQKQRLALACALAGDPELIFLDEPTTGLDPQSRRQLWTLVEELRASGRTLVLTTHYMDEAEKLCDRVAIVDRGRVIALGTPRSLIADLGAEAVVFFAVEGEPMSPDDVAALSSELGSPHAPRQTNGGYELQVSAPHAAVPALLERLQLDGRRLSELRTHTPTLEDVFVSLTGRALRDG